MIDLIDITISVVISVGVGFVILFYQRKLGKKIDNLIIRQNQIIGDEYAREGAWKSEWGNRIILDLDSIKRFHEILHKWLVDYVNNRSEANKDTLIFSAERLGHIVNFNIQNLRENIPKIEKYLKDPLISTHIIKQTDHYLNTFSVVHADWAWKENGVEQQIRFIESMTKTLSDVIERMRKEIIASDASK